MNKVVRLCTELFYAIIYLISLFWAFHYPYILLHFEVLLPLYICVLHYYFHYHLVINTVL